MPISKGLSIGMSFSEHLHTHQGKFVWTVSLDLKVLMPGRTLTHSLPPSQKAWLSVQYARRCACQYHFGISEAALCSRSTARRKTACAAATHRRWREGGGTKTSEIGNDEPYRNSLKAFGIYHGFTWDRPRQVLSRCASTSHVLQDCSCL